ncbi:helix-turn-helix domain-containing protein [Furfurilactobacillus rossiae]|uniref:HTH araC/xylS-type domain-containing protein n=1 Tax=Furfurilactobacillus rossiae DSM 15814 TaxID=1114972 RepID=A0A0R1RGR2_9LACO|nr:helix-turn-helix domain-containing protein [Furfurilactobacillus rossiae]KRL56141.1 hypothetical protein FD35_GL002181 [Furfurilactobacillus rossiae DSM 15814]QFR66166.1 helix-turn-helix domain-containing protein [Furfurilactobacillus rossiae]QLE61598.1 two component transcriptional regulator AraC [Furfurilactobacillus rossiae]
MNNFLAQVLTADRTHQLNKLLANFSQATGSIATVTDLQGNALTNLHGFSLFSTFKGDEATCNDVPQNKAVHIDEHFSVSRLSIMYDKQAIGFVCCGYPAAQQNARPNFGPAGNAEGERSQASVTLLRLIVQREIDRYMINADVVQSAEVKPKVPVINVVKPQKQEALADSLNRINNIKTKNKEINDALIYIEQHLNQNISLEEVAQRVYLSSFYFSKLFKKSTHMNFSDYLAAKKIKRAMVLLQDTTTPVKQISQRLGFSQTSYFSKTFKKYTNTTPSEFRKSVQ